MREEFRRGQKSTSAIKGSAVDLLALAHLNSPLNLVTANIFKDQ